MADSKLSKNLLRMKFMQRGLDAETRKQLEEDERRIISDEHWYLDLPELRARENLILEEQSLVSCEDLKYGRFSFKGFNPEVEKLMVTMNPKEEEEERQEEEVSHMQTDVTDEEMALRYESLVGSMRKKFTRKKNQASEEGDTERVSLKRDQASEEGDTKRVSLKKDQASEEGDTKRVSLKRDQASKEGDTKRVSLKRDQASEEGDTKRVFLKPQD
ncbi:M-phase phosphoprotein 6 [Trematomus bernacchii]|uniref:M-phase phosphoprotein 6 n=1 Tax=Trematomus bernacchii TaxID=40690 RepID=UPI00146C0896|nr:M-phase phosphoprotein 6 [Trematomus bernacchii]